MKIIGENKSEEPVKELGSTIYYTNTAGDLMPVVATKEDGSNDYVRLTSKSRLRSQSALTGTFNPSRAAGLQFWVKKGYEVTNTSGRFTTWGDLSGNNNHLTGDAASPYVMLSDTLYAVMDGEGAKFTTASALSLTTFTICFACRSEVNKKNTLTGKGSDADAFIMIAGANEGDIALSLASGESYASSARQVTSRKDTLITIIRDSSNKIYMRVDGTQVYTTTAASTALQIDQIGKYGSATETFMGNIYEIAIYNTALSGDELSSLELGIMSRNGIT